MKKVFGILAKIAMVFVVGWLIACMVDATIHTYDKVFMGGITLMVTFFLVFITWAFVFDVSNETL